MSEGYLSRVFALGVTHAGRHDNTITTLFSADLVPRTRARESERKGRAMRTDEFPLSDAFFVSYSSIFTPTNAQKRGTICVINSPRPSGGSSSFGISRAWCCCTLDAATIFPCSVHTAALKSAIVHRTRTRTSSVSREHMISACCFAVTAC